ncbi:MAG: type II secretion system protein GspM [Thermodesulfovibrionales bacterium]|nr:type II secretion system protein GspM [Thermodesulfovibrionales bacterium]
MDVKSIKEKFKSLSQREKGIILINLVAIVVVVPYMLLYSPSVLQIKNKKQALQNLKQEIEATNAALASQAVLPKEPVVEKIVLPEAEDLSGMLAAISREATIANVDFVSIAPEGFVHKDKFIELKLKIELRVKFRELYDFIKILETRHKLFLIQELKFETNASLYPSGVALLKAVTYLRKKE